MESLRRALAVHPWREHPALPGRRNHLRAGVLVPLVWRPDGGLETLLTLRPATIRHGGELSFPGGRAEPSDPGLVDTALREAREELGLTTVDVLGRLSSMPVYTSDYRLEPFVARVDPGEVRPEPGEVERVVRVDLGAILSGAHIEAVGGVTPDAIPWEMPVFRAEGLVVYGATSLTLMELVSVVAQLTGREPPPLRRGPLTIEALFAHGARAGRVSG